MTWVRDDSGRLRWVYESGISHNEQDRAAGTTGSSTRILIGGQEFKAIKSTGINLEATISKRRIEDQSEIADNIVENPVTIDYVIELFDVNSEYELLEDLYKKKMPFSLVTYRGAFDNMVLQKLSDLKGQDSSETTTANITVQQIRIGKSETIKTSTVVQESLGAATEPELFPGSGALKITSVKAFTFVPEKTKEETAKEYTDKIIPVVASNQVQGLVAAMNTRRQGI